MRQRPLHPPACALGPSLVAQACVGRSVALLPVSKSRLVGLDCLVGLIGVIGLMAPTSTWAQADAALEPMVVGVVINAVPVSDGEIVHRVLPGEARRAAPVKSALAANAEPTAPQVPAAPAPLAEPTGFWIDTATLARWRLLPDDDQERRIEGQVHRRVCSQPALLRCVYDDSTALLTIDADGSRFAPIRLGVAPTVQSVPTGTRQTGGFANYDLFTALGDSCAFGGFADTRVFSAIGDFYWRAGLLETRSGARLLSRAMGWQWDMPEQERSLTVGGFVGGGTVLRPPMPMLGVRWASNGALRPEIARVPRPWVQGAVLRPSKAELFVDGLFRREGDVPYGRFEMEADALLAGAGMLQTVLTDQRGEQTVKDLPYYFAPQLLPAGHTDHAVEVGRLSLDPARLAGSSVPVFSAQHRQGVSNLHTLSFGATLTSTTLLAGGSSDVLMGQAGVLRAGLSVLDRGSGPRARWTLGHEYQSRRYASLFRVEAAPSDHSDAVGAASVTTFNASGASAGTGTPNSPARAAALATLPSDRRQGVASFTAALSERYQVGTSVLARTALDGQRASASTVSGNWRISPKTQLTLALQRAWQPRAATTVLLGWVVPLDAQHVMAVSATPVANRRSLQWSVQSARDEAIDGDDDQYRVSGQVGPRSGTGVSYLHSERYGQWSLDANQQGNTTRANAHLSGAIGWLGEYGFAGRRIDDGFLVVDSDGQADVPVYIENRFAGKTDAQGRLLVAEARAYQRNRVSIDAGALPIEFTVSNDELDVVPRSRAGVMARFEIGDGGELIRVRRADGTALPAGARAVVSTQTTPAAINSRGELFINRAKRPAEVDVSWPGGACRFSYRPDTPDAPREEPEGFACR